MPAALALAGHRDGAYAGVTEQAQPITFRVADGRVKRLEVVVYADCDDGSRQKVMVEDGRTRIEEGRFSLALSGDQGLEVAIAGRFRDSHASGPIRASLKPPGTACFAESRWQASQKATAI